MLTLFQSKTSEMFHKTNTCTFFNNVSAQVTCYFQGFRHLQFLVSFEATVLFKNKFSSPSIKKDTQDNQYQKPASCKKGYIKPNNSLSQAAIGIATVYTSQRAPMPNYEHFCCSRMFKIFLEFVFSVLRPFHKSYQNY